MAEKNSSKSQVISAHLDSLKSEYAELCDTWRSLDVKAQGTVTICGVFVAGIFAVLREMSATSDVLRWAITADLLFLCASIACSLHALYITEVSGSPSDDIALLVEDLLRQGDIAEQRLDSFSMDQARIWKEVNADVRSANEKKANSILLAQRILGFSMLIMAFTVLLKIWS